MNICLLVLQIYGWTSVRSIYHIFLIGFAISECLLTVITLTLFICKINVLAKSACSTERYWHRADLSVCDLWN